MLVNCIYNSRVVNVEHYMTVAPISSPAEQHLKNCIEFLDLYVGMMKAVRDLC